MVIYHLFYFSFPPVTCRFFYIYKYLAFPFFHGETHVAILRLLYYKMIIMIQVHDSLRKKRGGSQYFILTTFQPLIDVPITCRPTFHFILLYKHIITFSHSLPSFSLFFIYKVFRFF